VWLFSCGIELGKIKKDALFFNFFIPPLSFIPFVLEAGPRPGLGGKTFLLSAECRNIDNPTDLIL
jgi:hypothetical protein